MPRIWAVGAALSLVTASGLFLLAPTLLAQVFAAREGTDAPDLRRVEILAGRGSAVGVRIRDVETADLTDFKLATPRGAIVERVEPGSPAEKAGLRARDVIVDFDGESVRSARQLSRLVDETPAGRPVTITILRSGARVVLDVTPEAGAGPRFNMEWEGAPATGRRAPAPPSGPGRPPAPDIEGLPGLDRLPEWREELDRVFGGGPAARTLGVGVQELSDQLADYFGVKRGVLVTSVRPDSPAATAGLRAGDVITSLDGREVASSGDLRRLLRETTATEVTIGLVRDKKALSFKATLERPGRASGRRWSA
jgi:serine protease Do